MRLIAYCGTDWPIVSLIADDGLVVFYEIVWDEVTRSETGIVRLTRELFERVTLNLK